MAIPEKISFKAFVVALVLGIVVLGAVFLVAKQRLQKPPTETAPLSKEEILQSLSPSIGPGQEAFSLKEKKKILENLSTPQGAAKYTDEEKKAIIESLRPPNQ